MFVPIVTSGSLSGKSQVVKMLDVVKTVSSPEDLDIDYMLDASKNMNSDPNAILPKIRPFLCIWFQTFPRLCTGLIKSAQKDHQRAGVPIIVQVDSKQQSYRFARLTKCRVTYQKGKTHKRRLSRVTRRRKLDPYSFQAVAKQSWIRGYGAQPEKYHAPMYRVPIVG